MKLNNMQRKCKIKKIRLSKRLERLKLISSKEMLVSWKNGFRRVLKIGRRTKQLRKRER